MDKVVFVMSSHERESITLQNIEHLCTMGEVVVTVTNESEFELYDRKTGAYVFKCDNSPLGNKWQTALDKAKLLNPDYIIPVGSDDFLCYNYFDNAKRLISKGYDFVGVNGWYMSDGKQHFKSKYKLRTDFPAGSGRVFTKKALDACNWQLYERSLNRLLDDKALAQMKNANIKTYISQDQDKDGLKILALKGRWNCLNPLDKFFTSKTIRMHRISSLPETFPKIQL